MISFLLTNSPFIFSKKKLSKICLISSCNSIHEDCCISQNEIKLDIIKNFLRKIKIHKKLIYIYMSEYYCTELIMLLM